VVVVRMRQHHGVQSSIPGWNDPIQLREKNRTVRAAVHEDATTFVAVHQNGVTLADVEDDDVDSPVRRRGYDRDGDHDGKRRRAGDESVPRPVGLLSAAGSRVRGFRAGH
jgi:hypothetical protein